MSLHKGMEAVLGELPKGFHYRITYDQSAKHGRWRIVAVDNKHRDAFGGSGATLEEARDMVRSEYKRNDWWIKDAERVEDTGTS